MSWSYVFKKFSRRFQDDFRMSCQDALKISTSRLQNAFKASCEDVFKTFSRHIIKLNCTCQHAFKTSLKRIQHIFETYCKNDYQQKNLRRSFFLVICGQGTKIPTFKTVYEVTASANKDIIVKVRYYKRCCYCSK